MTAAALLFSGKAVFQNSLKFTMYILKKNRDFRMILKANSESMEG